MHQLQQLIGEKAVNTALRSLLAAHAYPKAPPTAQDLLHEIYKASPQQHHAKIDELFKRIITYESKIGSLACNSINNGWEVSFTASVHKFSEDGLGKRIKTAGDSTIEAGIYTEDGKMQLHHFNIVSNRILGKVRFSKKPVRIVLDPYLKTMDGFLADNEKACE
jgi:ABC-2 type transport system permease protein